jgi:hypothetical protein
MVRRQLYPEPLGSRYGWALLLLGALAVAVLGAVALRVLGVR